MSNVAKPFPIPTSYFGLSLGLGALAMAWRHAGVLFPEQANFISAILGFSATVLWIIFFIAYVTKWKTHREQAKTEFKSAIQFSFISLIPISGIVVGMFLLPYQSFIAHSFIFVGIVVQLLFSAVRVGGLWRGDAYCETAILPPFYLPSVAANFSSAAAMGVLGYQEIGYLFLGAGIFSWLSFEPIILQRIRVAASPEPLRPTMGIILAPAFVAAASYLALNGGEIDLFVKLLWGYGLLQLFFLIRIFPWLWQKGFTIGFWAFSFGLASLANSAISFIHHAESSLMVHLAWIAFILANIAILGLILGTLLRLTQGKFLVK
ncbi:tellurite resistance protein TehA [Pasteurellaceae bacterium Macca]|nr:tellurite resistance protein TehA [Pasteurellaceae bacterium Macca]